MPIIKVRMGSMTGINLTDSYIQNNTIISDATFISFWDFVTQAPLITDKRNARE